MKLSSMIATLLVSAAIGLVPANAQAKKTDPAIAGEYLVGSYAYYLEDKVTRSEYFSRAFNRAPDDVRLGRLAMVSAIETGDMERAVDLAKVVIKTNKTESMARALLGVDAFRRGRESRAAGYFEPQSLDITMSILMRIVSGWNAYGRGKQDEARKVFTGLSGAGFFESYGQLQLAKLETQLGNYKAADAAFKRVEGKGVSEVETVLSRAQYFMAQRDKDGALKLLKAYDAENDTFGIGVVPHYINLIETGGKLPIAGEAKAQAARALTDPSLLFFYRNRSVDGAEIYLRFARWIDPSYDKSAIWLGDLLENSSRKQEAYALYNTVGDDSPYYVSARLNESNYYFDLKEDDKALEILENLSKARPSFITREALGRARFIREDYAGALPFYDKIINSMSEAELKDNITPLRLRGIIYERLDQWPLAEADFKRVLALSPDDVDTLNYLGYTWVDRGENLTEAFDMIRKAVAEEPESGAIVDSLGWAHYKLGQYDKAKEKLEDAVALSPSSATIIDHLGDVYWKLGRKREAGFQWKRALEFDPTDEEKEAIALKLKSGLPAALSQQ